MAAVGALDKDQDNARQSRGLSSGAGDDSTALRSLGVAYILRTAVNNGCGRLPVAVSPNSDVPGPLRGLPGSASSSLGRFVRAGQGLIHARSLAFSLVRTSRSPGLGERCRIVVYGDERDGN